MSLIHHEKTQITLDTETCLMWQDDSDAKDLKLTYFQAQIYAKKLRLGGFSDWEIPNIDSLINLGFKKRELKNISISNLDTYWSSSTVLIDNLYKMSVVSFQFIEIWDTYKEETNNIKCVRKQKINIPKGFNYKKVNENSIVLSSLEYELCYLKYKDEEYLGFPDEILEKLNFQKEETSTNLSEIINQKLEQKINEYLKVDEIEEKSFNLITKESFFKDEFETKAEFDERVNQFIEKQNKEYELRQIEYKNRVENLGDIKGDFIFEIFAQTMGIPTLKDALYDAETNYMYMTLFMTNCSWQKSIKVNIPNREIAKNFKTKLNEVKVDVTFDLKNEEFVFSKVELQFEETEFKSIELEEEVKKEEIRVDFNLISNNSDLESKSLPQYALEIKTLDNQKLEDEIENLKNQLLISQNKNQLLTNDNQILNNEIEELKKSNSDLKSKDNEILNLKNSIDLSNQKINDFGFKYRELEEKYQNIVNNNQTLNSELKILKNELVNKEIQIEDLKKYCIELELNVSSKQEEQKSSKVVERESFSDF